MLQKLRHKVVQTQQAIEDSLDSLPEYITETKRAELRAGVNADGGNIAPTYSVYWKEVKDGLGTYNAPSGTPDLYYSGKFHKSIETKRDGSYGYSFALNNPPEYADDLLKIYKEPSGLSKTGSKKVAIYFVNDFRKRLKKIW